MLESLDSVIHVLSIRLAAPDAGALTRLIAAFPTTEAPPSTDHVASARAEGENECRP
jgi:hypothetical protein